MRMARNYAAEYKRRVANAYKTQRHLLARRKLTAAEKREALSFARGHAPNKTVLKFHKATRFDGVDLQRLVNTDAKDVFGARGVPKLRPEDYPQLQPGESWSPALHALLSAEMAENYRKRLVEAAKRDGKLDWTNEERFIEQVEGYGATTREAYTFWFSP